MFLPGSNERNLFHLRHRTSGIRRLIADTGWPGFDTEPCNANNKQV